MAQSVARATWGWYRHHLSRSPVRTQIVTSGVLWAVGDCIAQRVDQAMVRRKEWEKGHRANRDDDISANAHERDARSSTPSRRGGLDARRVLSSALFGAAFVGPVGHFWYEGLEYVVRHKLLLRPHTPAFLAAKIFCDTVLFGPIHLAAYFTWAGLAAGAPLAAVRADVARDLLPALLTEGAAWPLVQAFNFRYVPVAHQLLFVNAFCVADSAFLSWFKFQQDAPWKQRLSQLVLGPPEGAGAGAGADHTLDSKP